MDANHPRLTTQKTLYVEISRARHRADLVTDDRDKLRERLEGATGERIAALESVETEPEKRPDSGRESERKLEAGAASIVSKSATSQQSLDAVFALYRQGNARDCQSSRQAFLLVTNSCRMGDRADDSPHQVLTVRELAILVTIAEGHTLQEVAKLLQINQRTVGNVLVAIRRQLDIPRERFRSHAIEHCLIDPFRTSQGEPER